MLTRGPAAASTLRGTGAAAQRGPGGVSPDLCRCPLNEAWAPRGRLSRWLKESRGRAEPLPPRDAVRVKATMRGSPCREPPGKHQVAITPTISAFQRDARAVCWASARTPGIWLARGNGKPVRSGLTASLLQVGTAPGTLGALGHAPYVLGRKAVLAQRRCLSLLRLPSAKW